MAGSASLSSSSVVTRAVTDAGSVRRSRRSWSRDEKRRIVDETFRPGSSVADVARRHGLNANLVFNWRKASWVTGGPTASAEPSVVAPVRGKEDAGFVPIGVFARADDEGPALIAGTSPRSAASPSPRRAAVYPAMAERVGVIEIELVDGTRLRVDGFVNERALRRVLATLKAAGT
jgi:transposase